MRLSEASLVRLPVLIDRPVYDRRRVTASIVHLGLGAFHRAHQAMYVDRLLEHGDVVDGGEHRDVLEAYRMFAYDRGWQHKLEEAVATGLTAEAAVERVERALGIDA